MVPASITVASRSIVLRDSRREERNIAIGSRSSEPDGGIEVASSCQQPIAIQYFNVDYPPVVDTANGTNPGLCLFSIGEGCPQSLATTTCELPSAVLRYLYIDAIDLESVVVLCFLDSGTPP